MRGFGVFILIGLAFVLGIYVTNTYQVNLFNQTKLALTQNTQPAQPAQPIKGMCPSSEAVIQHVGQSGAWEVDGLSWSIKLLGWQPPKEIQFNQAFYYPESQSLTCSYTWTDPKEQGLLSLRVALNAAGNQSVKQVGLHWVKVEKVFMCTSGTPATCSFEVTSD